MVQAVAPRPRLAEGTPWKVEPRIRSPLVLSASCPRKERAGVRDEAPRPRRSG